MYEVYRKISCDIGVVEILGNEGVKNQEQATIAAV
jgi:hypothetical protein